jgi:hypothetical protein
MDETIEIHVPVEDDGKAIVSIAASTLFLLKKKLQL